MLPVFLRRGLVACVAAALSVACGPAPLADGGDKPVASAGDRTPRSTPERPLRAAFLVVDGVYNSELMAPYDVLQHTAYHSGGKPAIEVFAVSPTGAEIQTFEGLRLQPHYGFGSAPAVDILVVPSAEHSMDTDLENEPMISWVRRTGRRARFVVSLCEGAFVLAQAGLLEGRACTTFPGDYERFEGMFPHLDLRTGMSFVHDGPLLTSQGGARSYDVAMYLVDLLYGESVARGVGRGLLIPWPPSPGQMPHLVVEPETHDE